MTVTPIRFLSALAVVVGAFGAAPTNAADLIRQEFYVRVKSTAPAINGREARVYVREVMKADTAPAKGVVLFVHGAGTPSEVSFDVPYQDYS